MKKIFPLIIPILFLASHSFSQKPAKPLQPFIIQGCILNLQQKSLSLHFRDDSDFSPINLDIEADSSGRFYLKTYKVNKPVTAELFGKNVRLAHLFIAPGYNLTITGDGKDGPSFAETKRITGYGSAANEYLRMRDSIIVSYYTRQGDYKEWFQLNTQDFLSRENTRKRLYDSIIRVVFDKKKASDPYYNFFRNSIEINNKFERIDHITWHTVVDSTLKSYRQTIDFVAKNIDTIIFSGLFDEKYLALDAYRDFMMNGYYQYLYDLEYKKAPSLIDKNKYRLDNLRIINNVYKGRIKYATLYGELHQAIEFCRSWDELHMYKKAFPQYISELPEQSERDGLKNMIASKEAELIHTQVGKPAPEFTAPDSAGKIYDLASYKGKVVLLDLWASWCHPCRYETPYLEKIVEKYKADNRMAFISVAVFDTIDKWKMAMLHDKPTWLQLFDNNGAIPDSYVAHSIPKFIIINKQGNIISFDAPMPSDGGQLEKILDAELAK